MDWHGRPSEWVGDWSARRAALTPDRVALVDWTSGERYSYADLDRRANRTARLLERASVADGERVAVVSRNRVEPFDLFFATGKTGGVLAPLSHRLPPPELGELLDLVDPRLLVVEAPFTGLVADAVERADVDPDALQLPAADRRGGEAAGGEDARGVEAGGADAQSAEADGVDARGAETNVDDADGASTPLAADPYHDALPADDAPVEPASIALDDVHLLLHTGGSTGTPKETRITHGSIAWNSLNTIASWGLRDDDVAPMAFPTFHTGGWNVLTVPLLHLGGRLVIDREVEPGRLLDQIETERATVFVAVPAVLRAMATHDDWSETDLSTLRLVKSGGGPCREAVLGRWRDRGVDLSQGYGLTECGPNDFAMPDDWPEEKVASVGKPVLHGDARIVDDDGEPVPDGEVGELELAGPHAAAGYWRNEAETEATFGASGGSDDRDGGECDFNGSDSDDPDAADGRRWVSTGDLARVDADGYYHVVGRKKTMFVSGGENVYPPLVEDAIAEHPAVDDAVVVGVPDERWGTVGKAIVVLGDDAGVRDDAAVATELEAFLDGRLAGFEIPQAWVTVDELPRSGPGKIDRSALQREFGGEQRAGGAADDGRGECRDEDGRERSDADGSDRP